MDSTSPNKQTGAVHRAAPPVENIVDALGPFCDPTIARRVLGACGRQCEESVIAERQRLVQLHAEQERTAVLTERNRCVSLFESELPTIVSELTVVTLGGVPLVPLSYILTMFQTLVKAIRE